MKRRVSGAFIAAGLVLAAIVPAAFAGAPSTIVVDDDGMATAASCGAATATHDTIQEGVNAAAPGDTVLVCPGNYNDGQVVVDRSVDILGAHAGDSARSCVPRGGESKVFGVDEGDDTGAFRILADNVAIDGFLIENNLGPGIQADAANHGHRVVNNLIRNNVLGLYLNADPAGSASRSYVGRNCFAENNVPGPANGNGIYSDQGLRHTTIDANTFVHHMNSGILLISGFPGIVKNTTVVANRSVDDRTYLTAYNAIGLYVAANSVVNDDESFGDAGSAIYIGGGSDVGGNGSNAVTLLKNRIVSDHFAGIAVRGSADNVVVKSNTINGTTRGVDVSSDANGSSLVKRNRITNVGEFGIYLQSGTSENQIALNVVSGSGTTDCQDDSSGSGTAGTDNNWVDNTGATSSPAGLCEAP